MGPGQAGIPIKQDNSDDWHCQQPKKFGKEEVAGIILQETVFNQGKEKKVPAAERERWPAGDYPRQISYRPKSLVTDRPPIMPVTTAPESTEEAASSKKVPLERPPVGIINLDDPNIPAFLRKQMD